MMRVWLGHALSLGQVQILGCNDLGSITAVKVIPNC